MGNVQPTGGSRSPSHTSSTTSTTQTRRTSKRDSLGYSKLQEAEDSFSEKTEKLDFYAHSQSEKSSDSQKKPLMAQSSPPDIKHDRSAETKPEVSRGKNGPSYRPSYRIPYTTDVPFDPSRLEELETLLKSELGDGMATQYRISFQRTERNTVRIKFTTRQKHTLARQQKPELDRAVNSALGAMLPGGNFVSYPSNLKEYKFDKVPHGSNLAGEVASIAERILRNVFGKCKVTQHHDDKGFVFYKVSKSGMDSHFKGISVPNSLKADIFMGLKAWIDDRQKKGFSLDDIASNSADVAKIEKGLRKYLSDKYGLDLVKE